MSERFSMRRMGVQLAAVTLGALAAGACALILLQSLAESTVYALCAKPEFEAMTRRRGFDRLQSYVETNGISSRDVIRLNDWVKGESEAALTLYRDGEVLYDSYVLFGDFYFRVAAQGAVSDAAAAKEAGRLCTLQLADGPVEADLYVGLRNRLLYLGKGTAVVLACGVVVTVLLAFIRRKTRYMHLLGQEMERLGGGDLQYPVTVRGQDELARLAASMDEMRLALRSQKQRQSQSRAAAGELVTALSHDLRTPLTSLLGYLDILAQGGLCPEKQAEYLEICRSKTLRIQEMSDTLFDYFLACSAETGAPVPMEPADGAMLLAQLAETAAADLELDGFACELAPPEAPVAVRASVSYLQRVADNLVSNLRKYADPAQPVEFACESGENGVRLRVSNAVAAARGSGSGVGLETCRRIAGLHGGSFTAEGKDGRWICELFLPRCGDEGEAQG